MLHYTLSISLSAIKSLTVWRAVSSPGGLGKQRIDTSFVRHYPAASPQRVAKLATPTELRSFRFMSVSLPGGLGKQRIDIGFVRLYPAASPQRVAKLATPTGSEAFGL